MARRASTRRPVAPPSPGVLRGLLGAGQGAVQLFAEAIEFLDGVERSVEQDREVLQDHGHDLALPFLAEADLLVEPVLEPVGVWELGLHRVVGEEVLAHVQVGGVQRLAAARSARHQHPDLGEGAAGLVAEFLDGPLHVLQVGACVPGFVARDDVVDLLDHRFGVPLDAQRYQ